MNGTIKDAIPELDVIAEHIKRFFWVGEYWFSAIFGEGTGYPISVPDYVGKGYDKDSDGGVLMVMRAEPKVTLTPGEGIHVVRCRCTPIPEGTTNAKKCTACACKTHTCSQLCRCKRTCLHDQTAPG